MVIVLAGIGVGAYFLFFSNSSKKLTEKRATTLVTEVDGKVVSTIKDFGSAYSSSNTNTHGTLSNSGVLGGNSGTDSGVARAVKKYIDYLLDVHEYLTIANQWFSNDDFYNVEFDKTYFYLNGVEEDANKMYVSMYVTDNKYVFEAYSTADYLGENGDHIYVIISYDSKNDEAKSCSIIDYRNTSDSLSFYSFNIDLKVNTFSSYVVDYEGFDSTIVTTEQINDCMSKLFNGNMTKQDYISYGEGLYVGVVTGNITDNINNIEFAQSSYDYEAFSNYRTNITGLNVLAEGSKIDKEHSKNISSIMTNIVKYAQTELNKFIIKVNGSNPNRLDLFYVDSFKTFEKETLNTIISALEGKDSIEEVTNVNLTNNNSFELSEIKTLLNDIKTEINSTQDIFYYTRLFGNDSTTLVSNGCEYSGYVTIDENTLSIEITLRTSSKSVDISFEKSIVA